MKDNSPELVHLPSSSRAVSPQQRWALEGSLTLFVPGFQAGNTVASRSCPVFSKGAESVPQAPVPGVHSPIRPGSPSLSTLGGKFRRVGSQILLPLFRASKKARLRGGRAGPTVPPGPGTGGWGNRSSFWEPRINLERGSVPKGQGLSQNKS